MPKRSRARANKYRLVLAVVLISIVAGAGYEYYQQQPQQVGAITTTEPVNVALMLNEVINWMYIALAILAALLLLALFVSLPKVSKEKAETVSSVTERSESEPEPQKDRKKSLCTVGNVERKYHGIVSSAENAVQPFHELTRNRGKMKTTAVILLVVIVAGTMDARQPVSTLWLIRKS